MTNNSPNPYEAPAVLSDQWVDPDEYLDGRLRTAAIGLKLIYYGALLVCIVWIAGVLVTILGFGRIVSAAAGMLAVVGLLLVNLGPVACLTVPTGHALRSLAVAAVVAQLLAWIGIFRRAFVIGDPALAASFGSMFGLVSAAMFLCFLYRLTHCIQRHDLAKRTRNVFIFGSLVLLSAVPLAYLVYTDTFRGGLRTLSLLWTISVFLLIVLYASLANAIGNAIQTPRHPN